MLKYFYRDVLFPHKPPELSCLPTIIAMIWNEMPERAKSSAKRPDYGAESSSWENEAHLSCNESHTNSRPQARSRVARVPNCTKKCLRLDSERNLGRAEYENTVLGGGELAKERPNFLHSYRSQTLESASRHRERPNQEEGMGI